MESVLTIQMSKQIFVCSSQYDSNEDDKLTMFKAYEGDIPSEYVDEIESIFKKNGVLVSTKVVVMILEGNSYTVCSDKGTFDDDAKECFSDFDAFLMWTMK